MSHVYEVVMGDRGRLVLPAPVRAELGIEPGARLVLRMEDDGSVRLRPYRTIAKECRGLFADTARSSSLVEELLAERRQEATREE